MFGRATEIKGIRRWANDIENGRYPNPLCFLGAPGVGKTSLLKHTKEMLQAKNWQTGYSEASPDASSAVDDFLEDAARIMTKKKMGRRFFAQLTEINVSAAGFGAGIKIGENEQSTIYQRVFRLFEALGESARRERVGVVFLIDEAQALPDRDLGLLMRVADNLDRYPVSLMIAGLPGVSRKLRGMPRDGPTRPETHFSTLGNLSSRESHEAIVTPVADCGGKIAESQVARIVRFTEGHPLTLRMLGASAWEYADEDSEYGQPFIIKEPHVTKAIEATRRQLSIAYHEPLWQQSGYGERRLLRALQSIGMPMSYDKYYNSKASKFRDSDDMLYLLQDRGVVGISNQEVLSFSMPGFGQFLGRHGWHRDSLFRLSDWRHWS